MMARYTVTHMGNGNFVGFDDLPRNSCCIDITEASLPGDLGERAAPDIIAEFLTLDPGDSRQVRGKRYFRQW